MKEKFVCSKCNRDLGGLVDGKGVIEILCKCRTLNYYGLPTERDYMKLKKGNDFPSVGGTFGHPCSKCGENVARSTGGMSFEAKCRNCGEMNTFNKD
jgi:phage FluMu protein Com